MRDVVVLLMGSTAVTACASTGRHAEMRCNPVLFRLYGNGVSVQLDADGQPDVLLSTCSVCGTTIGRDA